jgi:ribosomal protein L11 methyltransferase
LKNWIKVKAVFETAPADWSVCADIFDRHGCPGTLEEDNPPALSAYMAEVEGYELRLHNLLEDLKAFGSKVVETEIVPEEDWSSNWKQFFVTRKLGRVVIRPTWEDYEPLDGEIVITLDPGQAFGTGDHPTTRLCLELMQEVQVSGLKVADIGCGSGILAIAAYKMGAASTVASDIDPQSVEIAKENAVLNDSEIEFIAQPGFDILSEPQDLIFSNIISATLIRLAPDAARFIKQGGIWIVSGIIEQNWNDVRQTAEQVDFELIKWKQEGEWIGAIFRR